MPRSVWKGPFVSILSNDPVPKVSRSSTILPSQVGKRFLVHNGKEMKNILVTELMVSRKFGEFAFTRTHHIYKNQNQNQQKVKK